MAIPGEVLHVKETICEDCGTQLPLKVLHSGGGYYIGFFCPICGPYSRESGYYRTPEEAEAALNTGTYNR